MSMPWRAGDTGGGGAQEAWPKTDTFIVELNILTARWIFREEPLHLINT